MYGSLSTKKIAQKLYAVTARKRRGDVTKVAMRTGYSVSYVSEVLNAQYNNSTIVNAAYDFVRRRKQNTQF